MMTLSEIKNLGRALASFLAMFADCFASLAGRQLLRVYVKGQLSDVQRKNCEAMALKFNRAPRTLQRFLESIKWDEGEVRDRCQQVIARDHAHDEAIGTVDESGTTKSGSCTAAAARQYNGNRGKIENCTVGVHLGYSTPGFQTLLDSRLYLPEDWANNAARRKKTASPTTSSFRRSSKLRWV
jgi:SRSO17 transposase